MLMGIGLGNILKIHGVSWILKTYYKIDKSDRSWFNPTEEQVKYIHSEIGSSDCKRQNKKW